ncbi:hypothetical protein K3495_g4885 [Podosphaera aphanis]|nr:hypothetical protein K3495_g4885 [Podosphaera aphanis]
MAIGALGCGPWIVSLALLSGAIVMMFFVILSGVSDVTPLNRTWFLQADTSQIMGSTRALSQWTFFFICDAKNQNCGNAVPALPLGYAWIAESDGVPEDLIGSYGKHTTSRYFYYMWRFGWVSYLIGLVFVFIGWLVTAISFSTRIGSGIAGLAIAFGLIWYSVAASLMTVAFVKARNSFHRAGFAARVGRYAFGFTWGAWVALFIAMVLLFKNVAGAKHVSHEGSRRSRSKAGMLKP